eukprot:scaffold155552_cov19-Prasinocladus_malaysianus.AAC.1
MTSRLENLPILSDVDSKTIIRIFKLGGACKTDVDRSQPHTTLADNSQPAAEKKKIYSNGIVFVHRFCTAIIYEHPCCTRVKM